MPYPYALLIIGGVGIGGIGEDTLEIWSPEFDTCVLEPFGDEAKYHSTLDKVDNVVVSCLEEKCEKLQDGSWTLLTSTLVSRWKHTSAVLNSEILLFWRKH